MATLYRREGCDNDAHPPIRWTWLILLIWCKEQDDEALRVIIMSVEKYLLYYLPLDQTNVYLADILCHYVYLYIQRELIEKYHLIPSAICILMVNFNSRRATINVRLYDDQAVGQIEQIINEMPSVALSEELIHLSLSRTETETGQIARINSRGRLSKQLAELLRRPFTKLDLSGGVVGTDTDQSPLVSYTKPDWLQLRRAERSFSSVTVSFRLDGQVSNRVVAPVLLYILASYVEQGLVQYGGHLRENTCYDYDDKAVLHYRLIIRDDHRHRRRIKQAVLDQLNQAQRLAVNSPRQMRRNIRSAIRRHCQGWSSPGPGDTYRNLGIIIPDGQMESYLSPHRILGAITETSLRWISYDQVPAGSFQPFILNGGEND